MIWFILGLIIFFPTHHVRQLAPRWRERMIVRWGRPIWIAAFSAFSLLGSVLIVWGWGLARADAPDLYVPADWAVDANRLLSLMAFVLVAAFFFPAGVIKQRLRFPASLGIIIWCVGHLLANGDLLSFLLFGLFGLSSALSIVMEVRAGEEGPTFKGYRGDLLALLFGGALYVGFAFYLHGPLIGVSPY